MEKSKPGLYITRMTKAARANKIYLDYLRNDRESTAIAAFSTRGRPGIPVALPLDWKELEATTAPRFYLLDFARWKKRMDRDPWKALTLSTQRLADEALRELGVKVQ
jgi:bifunctional non-homologous end joining protein LigD